jgi:hypothetical protein
MEQVDLILTRQGFCTTELFIFRNGFCLYWMSLQASLLGLIRQHQAVIG